MSEPIGPKSRSAYSPPFLESSAWRSEAADREELLQLAERSAGIGIWDMDMKTQQVRGSPQFFNNLGLTVGNGTRHINEIRALRHAEDNSRVLRTFRDAVSAGSEYFETEYRIIRPDGETRWIFSRGRVIRNESGEPARYSGVDLDITERKRVEEALVESEIRYRTLVENASDLVFTLDLDLKLTSANPAACRLLGYSAEEMLGAPIHRFVPANQLQMHRDMLARKLAGEASETRYEMQVVGSDGRFRTLETSTRLSFDQTGVPVGIHAIARDITERKQYEERLALTSKELSHRTKNILAVVQAITSQIGRRAKSFEDFERRLMGCIAALAHSHDLLVEGEWQGASLAELIQRQLTPFDLDDTRFTAEGPDVILDPQATQIIGLALHELATNALKHGSLAIPTGLVSIRWKRSMDKLVLAWIESRGPSVVEPKRRGFGTVVLERMASSVDGSATLLFLQDGIRWELNMSTSHLVGAGPHSRD